MKYITFVRHAKSSWDSFSIPDHDRPLNNRGERDSKFMGKKLYGLGFVPQRIIASSAKRTQLTANNLSKDLGTINIVSEDKLYESSADSYLNIINEIDDSYNDIMIVGHNPTMTEIINIFSDEFIYNVPTTGIFRIEFDVDKWSEVKFESGKLLEYIYPKMFKNEL